MRFRFRIGPFTFGRGGTRLSLWSGGSGGSGISIPLSRKNGRSFGKIGVGPLSVYVGGSTAKRGNRAGAETKQRNLSSDEGAVIKAFGSDQQFLEKLRRYGVPWRGVQERLKEELPERLAERDTIAFKLVPKAMDTVFGQQNTAWTTEKRSSKSGGGFTT